MPFLKNMVYCMQINPVFINLTWFYRFRSGKAITKTAA